GAAQKKDHDRKLAGGTMSRSGATCPCCGTITTGEDIRLESKANRLGQVLTAVVVEERSGKAYRLPTSEESRVCDEAAAKLGQLWEVIPFGQPEEPIPQGASRVGGGSPFTVHLYGITRWRQLFSNRQLLAVATFANHARNAREAMKAAGY